MTTFTLNNTTYRMNPETGRYSKTYFNPLTGKDETKRVGKAEFEEFKASYLQLLQMENERQNAANQFTNIEAIEESYEEVVEEEPVEVPEVKAPKTKKTRKAKDAQEFNISGTQVLLTTKQIDFLRHLPDTCFWEHGLDSEIWIDCLCDDIQGQFAGKPMTVGAMVSTLCEKGLGFRATERREKKKCTSFGLTELGKQVADMLGVH